MTRKNKKIFVSHAVKNKDVVHPFIEIVKQAYQVADEDLFCSSLPGVIPAGSNFSDDIKKAFIEADLIILMLSHDFKSSEFCMSELGAAWVNIDNKKVLPIIIPPASFELINGAFTARQGATLDNIELAHWLDPMMVAIGYSSSRETFKALHGSKQDFLNNKFEEMERNRLGKKFDLFISTPMSKIEDFARKNREIVGFVEELEASDDSLTVYYAGRELEDKDDFLTSSESAEDDLKAAKQSRCLVLLMREKTPGSSCAAEVTWALAHNIPVIFVYKDDVELPFMLKGLSEVNEFDVRKYPYSDESKIVGSILSGFRRAMN